MTGSDFGPARDMELSARYGIEADPDSIGRLCAAHGLTYPGADVFAVDSRFQSRL